MDKEYENMTELEQMNYKFQKTEENLEKTAKNIKAANRYMTLACIINILNILFIIIANIVKR